MKTYTGETALALAALFSTISTPGFTETQVLEEIVVTAQHRAQPERDLGISMAVFSEEAIGELAIENSFDVAKHTPGFNVSNAGGAGVPVYTMRGVGFDDHQPNSSATVGIYQDQVAQPYPLMTMGLQHDLSRIEVLKGPQGDLYGRNTTGGALNYISNRPTSQTDGGIRIGAGNFETLDLRGFVNVPLGEAVRGRVAAAGISRNEGWQENELNGDLSGAYDEYSVRTMLDILATDNVDIALTLRTERLKGEPQTPQSTVVLPASNQTAAFLNSLGMYPLASLDPLMVSDQDDSSAVRWNRDPEQDRRQAGFSAVVDWRIGDLTLTSVTGYDQLDRDLELDWDGTPARLLEISAETEIRSISQEFRLASPDEGPLTWIAGVYLSHDTVDDVSHYDDSESPTLGFTFGSDASQDTDSTAIFGNLRWEFSEQFRLNLGGRYTDETRSIENCTVDTGDGSAVNALLTFQALGMLTLTNPEDLQPGGCVHLEGTGGSTNPPAPDVRVPGLHEDEINTDHLTGKIGLDWLPNDDWLLFTSVATGFKSGGFNMFSALVVDQFEPYEDELLTSLEIGFKGRLLDDRVMVSGSAFLYDYEDKQVSTFIPDQLGIFPGLVGIQNVPDSRIQGLELGADWLLSAGFSLTANVSFLDTEIREYENAFDVYNQEMFDAEGMALPNAPELAYQLMGVYERSVAQDMMIRLSMAYTWQDETYSQISAIDEFRVDAYGLFDARVTLGAADGRWSVSLWGRNLGDETYWFSNALAQDNIVRYTGIPRTYGLSFDYNLN